MCKTNSFQMSSWKMASNAYISANNKGLDQPERLSSMISICVVGYFKSMLCILALFSFSFLARSCSGRG